MFRISIFVPCILLMLPFSRSLNVCKVVRHRSFSAFQSTDKNASPTSIEYKVMQFLSNECKISANSYILLSVSGGLDSMALLHILSSISNKNIPLNLEVISFNHKLREESDEEVTFVASWAKKYNLPFHERILPPNKRNLVGLQASAREWRRQECFKTMSDFHDQKVGNIGGLELDYPSCNIPPTEAIEKDKNIPRSVVFATAHHADDQHETMLLKLIRGAYITNLQPMLPRSPCNRIIHPLLGIPKVHLKEYMIKNDFEWREDSSNGQRKYKRNVVRLDVLPVMQELAGGSGPLGKRFSALAEQSKDLKAWVDKEVDTFLSLHYPNFFERKDKDTLRSLNNINIHDKRVELISINITESSPFNSLVSPILQREVLHRFYTHLSDGKSLSYEVTCQILQLTNEKNNLGKREKVLNLDKNISAIKIGNFLQLKKCTENIMDIENTKIVEKSRKIDENDTDDEDESDGDMCKDVRKIHLNSEKEKVFDGLTYICDKGINITIRKAQKSHIESEVGSFSSDDKNKEVDRESLYSERGFFVKSVDGFRNGNGNFCNNFTVSLYNIQKDSVLEIRFPRDGDRFQPHWRKTPARVVDLMRMLKVPVHTRCNVPVIVLKEPTTTSTSATTHSLPPIKSENEFENGGYEGVSDNTSMIDKNDALNSYTEQIICIPPYVTQEHSAEHSKEHYHISAKDLISIEVIFNVKN